MTDSESHIKTVLMVGATGATGRLLAVELLARGHRLRMIVRSPQRLPAPVRDHPNSAVTQANFSDIDDETLAEQVRDCDAVVSCLGHTLSFKGMFGPPRRLVTDATRRLCEAIHANESGKPVKFILMNTAGNRNHDLGEKVSVAERFVLGLLRILIPPHADNEQAADYLRLRVGRGDDAVEWVAVRPDSLVDHDTVSEYTLHPSPVRSAIFNSGKTSRINVAHFMADLIDKAPLWSQWRAQMPVIYNK